MMSLRAIALRHEGGNDRVHRNSWQANFGARSRAVCSDCCLNANRQPKFNIGFDRSRSPCRTDRGRLFDDAELKAKPKREVGSRSGCAAGLSLTAPPSPANTACVLVVRVDLENALQVRTCLRDTLLALVRHAEVVLIGGIIGNFDLPVTRLRT